MLVQRLGSGYQKDIGYIKDVIKVIKDNPGSCDEIWFATDYGYPPLSTHKETAKLLKEYAKLFRENGIKVSLQLSNTIGHGEYMSAKDCSGLVYKDSPVGNIVDENGTKANYAFCFRDPVFIEYIKQTTLEYACIEPDKLWLDDDLRLFGHAPAQLTCFCDNCIKKYNEQYSLNLTREQIKEGILNNDTKIRESFFEFTKKGVGDFVYEICSAFHKKSPNTAFGFQCGDLKSQLVYGIDYILDSMKRAGEKPSCLRPGGGNYNDHNPLNTIEKSMLISYITSNLPSYVTDISPEIENLPDVVYGKSPAGTCFETSLYFAGGATGMTYAMIMRTYEPFSYHAKIFKEFSRQRNYWENLVKVNDLTIPSGLNFAFADNVKNMPLAENNKTTYGFHLGVYDEMSDFCRTAIPFAFDNKKKDGVYYLNIHNSVALSKEKMQYLTTQNVICDAESFNIINNATHKFDCTFKSVDANIASKLSLQHTDNELNGEYKNTLVSSGFCACNFYYFDGELNDKVIPITKYRTEAKDAENFYNSKEYPLGIGDAIVTSVDGVKWFVVGTGLTNSCISLNRRNNLIQVINYLQKGTVKVILKSDTQAYVMARETFNGKVKSVSIANITVGKTEELEVEIINPVGSHYEYISQYGKKVKGNAKINDNKLTIKVPGLVAYSVGTIFLK